jgi:hypothetical protein
LIVRKLIPAFMMAVTLAAPATATVPAAFGGTSLNIFTTAWLQATGQQAAVSQSFTSANASLNDHQVGLAGPVTGGFFGTAPAAFISASARGTYGSGSATHASSTAQIYSNLLNSYARSETRFHYSVRVNGPSGSVVPLRVDTVVYGSDNGFDLSVAGGQILISGRDGKDELFNQCYQTKFSGNSCIVAPFVMGSQYINVRPNEAIEVRLSSYASVSSHRDGAFQGDPPVQSDAPHMANYYVDPFFEIDPMFGDRDLFSLEFSPGVSNNPISGVPEAETWATMILGFFAMGSIMRRQRKLAASA